MLNVSPDNLRTEIDAGIRLRRRHTALSKMLIERFVGSGYREDWVPDMPSHENHEFEFVVNIMPALIAQNPKFNVKSRRPSVHRELTEAMQHGLNRWTADVDLQARLEPIIEDSQFDFGVAVVTMEAQPGYTSEDNPPMRPNIRRISPRRYFKDVQGGTNGCRFMGHVIIRDRDDLLNDKHIDGTPKYDAEAVESLSSPNGADDIVDDPIFNDLEISVERGQVVYAEVFVPETGMIYTVGFSSVANSNDKTSKGGKYLRKPRPYFGPTTGPYIELGYYIVPDQVYPLPPLAITHDIVDELNAHSEQVSRDADVSRNLVLYDSTNAALGDALKNHENGSVSGIPGFDTRGYAQVSFGGANPVQLDYITRLRERLDRRSGLTDIMRGNVTGDGTATEAKLAAAAASGRVKFMQTKTRRFVIEIAKAAAWLMFHSKSIVFRFSVEEAEKIEFAGLQASMTGEPMFRAKKGQSREGVFLGGVQEGQDPYAFYDLELEIEPYSMEEVNEVVLQKRMETAFARTVSVAQMIPQMPWVNWPELLDDYYQSMNIPDGRKYINFEMISQIMQMQFSAGAPQALPGMGKPMPDLDRLLQGDAVAANQSPTAGTGDAVQETASILTGAA